MRKPTHIIQLVSIFVLATLLLSACDISSSDTGGNSSGGGGSIVSGAAGGLPDMPDKPEPKVGTYHGCPPEGDGGDPALNRLKNRVDEGDYVPVDFSAILNLTWPATAERRDRDRWSEEDTAAIAQYESIPVAVEGYLYGGKESGPESTNCHGSENDYVDWHVWFTETPGEDRTRSLVVEPTPRVRVPRHPNWSLKQIKAIAGDQLRVRLSGWTFFDPEHPDQIGKTRGTIWEIHPVMNIEVKQDGQWIPLDDWTGN
jgi:hypothetical protein